MSVSDMEDTDESPLKSLKRKRENLVCDTCGIEVNSELMMEAHIHGQKHLKKIKLKSIDPSLNNKDATIVKSNYKSILQLMNELAKFNKVIMKYDLIKETGPPHAKQFDVQLTIANEVYAGTGTSIKRAQQAAAEQGLLLTALKKPEENIHLNVLCQSVNPNFENFLNKKSLEISQDEKIITTLFQLIENLEQAMKIVSDKIMEQYQKDNILLTSSLDEDPSESFRMIKGVMKVSNLAMRLFLKTDYEYTLVLVCATKPTVKLLNDICMNLNPSSDYQVEADESNACLIIKSNLLPEHTIRINLTSLAFLNENSINSDPIDMLDKTKCLQAATEMHHSNWFNQHLLNDEYVSTILRLLRYLQYHKTPLAHVNFWYLVLLIHQCKTQSIRDLFRGIFIYLSSGILLSKEISFDFDENDLLNLSIEQRLDITKYSQHILRLIAFEKYEQIFSY